MSENTANRSETKDVFLSYSRADEEWVTAIRTILNARGIQTFFDRDELLAGQPWPQALENGLRQSRGVAVFIGPSGLGLWQKREMALALDRQVAEERNQSGYPVIPVLLPGADVTAGFLFLNTWIDLRENPTDPEGLETLCRAIQGERDDGQQEFAAGLCPFQGLRPFNEESAAFFCGRETFSQRIGEAVLQRSLVAVIGPSGSGKSSVVQAGVLPLLRRQHAPSPTWDAVSFDPGDNPFQHMASALAPFLVPELSGAAMLDEVNKLSGLLSEGKARLCDLVKRALDRSGGTDRLLLVADHFEEVFTHCGEPVRQRFLDMLLEGCDYSPLSVVIVMRGSFYGMLIGADRRLSDRLENAVVNLGPMTRKELSEAISAPAKRLGLDLEAGLAKRILDAVGEEPGNLPVLEFALTELWTRREGKILTHRAYEQIGEVSGAIVQRAESVYAGLNSRQQEIAKRALSRLVWIGPLGDNSQESRQRVPFNQFDEEARRVLQVLAEGRLVVIGQYGMEGELTVEISHEALIRKWSRLREWLDEDREFLLWRRRLQISREIWRQAGEEETSLLKGTPLREAERWLRQCGEALEGEDGAFIKASLAVDESHRLAVHRRRRVFMATTSTLAVVFMCLAGLAGWESLNSLSQQLSATALAQMGSDPERSLKLGIEAVKAQPTPQAADVLKTALQNSLLTTLNSKLDYLTHVMFSPDGKILAATGKDRQPLLWDWDGSRLTDAHKPRHLPEHIDVLAANADWTVVAANNANHTASLYEVASGRVIGDLDGHSKELTAAAFSPDGSRLVTADSAGTARVWDMRSLESLRVLAGHTDRITDVAFSPDGARLVTASLDQTARVWNVQDGQTAAVLAGHRFAVNSARFSHDGQWIVTGSADNTARVWDSQTGSQAASLEGHTDSITFAAFSPQDGNLLLTTSRDRTGRVWKKLNGSGQEWRTINVLRGHTDAVTAAAFSPDGNFIATAGRDSTIRIWRPLNEHGRLAFFGHVGAVLDALFSPDRATLISFGSDNTARVWDIPAGKNPRILAGHLDSLTAAAFSPDGRLMMTGSVDHTAKIWDAKTGQLLANLAGHEDNVNHVAFDPTGTRAVTASDDFTAIIWDVNTGKVLHVLGEPVYTQAPSAPPATATVFSPTGAVAATLEINGQVTVREVDSGKVLAKLASPPARIRTLAFGPKGNWLATADSQGSISLWDTHNWRLNFQFQAHHGPITGIDFRPDGGLLVSVGEDRTLRLWDPANGQAKAKPFSHDEALAKAEFSRDGKAVIVATNHHTLGAFEIETGQLKGLFCPVCDKTAGHTMRVNTAEFSPDGQQVLTASRDGTARVWDAASGYPVAILDHKAPVRGAKFSPDGRRILAWGRDDKARLWERDGPHFKPLAVLQGHDDELTMGRFSPDGRLVATASRDQTTRVWDAATGKPLFSLASHHDWVNSAEFSPDGRWLATAGMDGTAKIWDIRDGSLKQELRGHAGPVEHVRFSEDGHLAATASRDGTVRLWDLKAVEAKQICPECSGSIAEICQQAHARTRKEFTPAERREYHLPWFMGLLEWRCSE